MTPLEDPADAAVFTGLGEAIMAVAPPRALAGAAPSARTTAAIAIHRNNVRAAYLRVLSDGFPVVHRLVGDGFFRYLSHEYFNAHPPTSPLVARYGDAMPEFLERFEPVKHLVYLPDIARLEIAWLDAYHAEEAQCLTHEEIVAALGDNPDGARISLHPSMRILGSPYPIHTIWAHNRQDSPGPLDAGNRGECVLLARPAREVRTRVISQPAAAAIIALQNGARLRDALSEAPTQHGDILSEILTANVITGAGCEDHTGA